jgi:hypothetical protein
MVTFITEMPGLNKKVQDARPRTGEDVVVPVDRGDE